MSSMRVVQSAKNHPVSHQTVSHDTTWSIYFNDPEVNRSEIFAETPWHVCQPCRFEVDSLLTDEALYRYTKRKSQHLPGFAVKSQWHASHAAAIGRVSEREHS